MSKNLLNTRVLATAIFAIAVVLAAGIAVPVVAAKDKALTKVELKNLIANAELKADHERIAEYFDAEAVRYESEAKEHAELAPFYQRNPDPALSKHMGSQRSFQHCDSLAKSLRDASENARHLAADHREMAKTAK